MRTFNSSRAAMALSAIALFAALGGTSWATSLISGAQIKNGTITAAKIGRGQVKHANLASGAVHGANLAAGAVTTRSIAASAVTSSQLADGAVTTTKIADNAVTSAKVQDGSLTASDVAPNTFLAAKGTATNSAALGGSPAADFVTGAGRMVSARLTVGAGSGPVQMLELGFGHISARCAAGAIPKLSFVAELNIQNLVDWTTNFGSPGSVEIQTTNALSAGNSYEEPHTVTTPQSVTWQATYNDGSKEQVATAWTTGQDEGGSCVFTGQAFTTL